MKTALTTAEVALRLGLDQHTITQYCRLGRLPAFKLAGRWFVLSADVQAFAKVARTPGPAPA